MGNVAYHLTRGFSQLDSVQQLSVWGRTAKNDSLFSTISDSVRIIHDISKLPDADLHIIAVQDDAISTVFNSLHHRQNIIVHTSGSVAHTILTGSEHFGVFYPLQTFSIHKQVDWTGIPIFIEASDPETRESLNKLAEKLSGYFIQADDAQRRSLHIAAVFANNFSNHMMALAQQWLEKYHLPFQVLTPLIRETITKLDQLTPHQAQTGPARRHDSEVIRTHLSILSNDPQLQEIYKKISASIEAMYPLE